MSDQQASSSSGRFEVRVTADSHFGWVRTRLSVERTMMSYMRTSVSLIGFGFAIVQFFHRVEAIPGENAARFPGAPWYLGLALIACGVLASVIALVDFRWTLRYLWSGEFAAIAGMRREGMTTPLYATSVVLILIGIFAFFAVLLKFV